MAHLPRPASCSIARAIFTARLPRGVVTRMPERCSNWCRVTAVGRNPYCTRSARPGRDGKGPRATLIFDGKGNLYGTTATGGVGQHGTVFVLSPGSEGWTETVIHNFWVNASNPQAGLVFDNAGNLYGTTLKGGKNGFGIVFELSPVAGGWSKKNIHQFSNGVGGGQPFGRLAFAGGNLYGTTSSGGAVGVGVVFELKPTSGGGWHETVLHAFQAGNDGADPRAGVILDKLGNLYGTTMDGGRVGQGAVFEVTP